VFVFMIIEAAGSSPVTLGFLFDLAIQHGFVVAVVRSGWCVFGLLPAVEGTRGGVNSEPL